MKKSPPKRIWVVVYKADDGELDIVQVCYTRKVALSEARADRDSYGWKTFVQEYQLVAAKKRSRK